MRKNVLLRTNLLVCIVIVVGFVATAFISYQSNHDIFRKDMESVTSLTAEGIYHKIDSYFIKPVNVSLTMANDSLLKEFLTEEEQRRDDASFIEGMRTYLDAYHQQYGYASVFLVSAQTGRYYNYNGHDRTLLPGNPENDWLYSLLASEEEYCLQIDNDEVKNAGNAITVFINCKIYGENGAVLGVVGVGFRVDQLQALFRSYAEQFGVKVSLVDADGIVQISTDQTGYEAVDHFASCLYPDLKDQILHSRDTQTLWYSSGQSSGYLVTAYVENLGWHLIVENDTTALDRALAKQFSQQLLVIVMIIAAVLIIITSVIHQYNKRIIGLAMVKEQAHRDVFQKATEQLYENIYELDITHNRAASEATAAYFESLGAPKHLPYDKALRVVAEKQIKEEFRQGYIDTFSPESVLKAYHNGVENLRYDFMISTDGKNYYWMRITAQLFYWTEDNSVRMLTYRQNIDEEKRRELYLYDQMQKDSLTGLLNKAATQENIRAMLLKKPKNTFAFFILDLDDFKSINDRLGHATGDAVLTEFARAIQSKFREGDVVGRIGGDEFVAFMPISSRQEAEKKAQLLVASLPRKLCVDAGVCEITSSIGVAIAPEAGTDFQTLYKNADSALYETKNRGRNGYTIYKPK